MTAVPIPEGHDNPHATANRQRLIDHIQDQDRVIRQRNAEIARLNDQIKDLLAQTSTPKGNPVTTYTAADFENATFATHPDGRIAMRGVSGRGFPWNVADSDWLTDAEMTEGGWTPARVVTTPREALEAAVELAHAPDSDVIPPGTGYLTVWNDGDVASTLAGSNRPTNADEPDLCRLLLDPPTPAWQTAELVEAATKALPERRTFMRREDGHWMDRAGWIESARNLIDPQPLAITKGDQ